MKKIKTVATLASLLGLGGANAQINIDNGDFDANPAGGDVTPSFWNVERGSADLNDFPGGDVETTPSGDWEWVVSASDPFRSSTDGGRWLSLYSHVSTGNVTTLEQVSQVLEGFVIGTTYEISFEFAYQPIIDTSDPSPPSVVDTGVILNLERFNFATGEFDDPITSYEVLSGPGGPGPNDWARQSFIYTHNTILAEFTEFTFSSVRPNGALGEERYSYIGVDNLQVRVVGIPEPTTPLLLSLASLSVMFRRSRQCR